MTCTIVCLQEHILTRKRGTLCLNLFVAAIVRTEHAGPGDVSKYGGLPRAASLRDGTSPGPLVSARTEYCMHWFMLAKADLRKTQIQKAVDMLDDRSHVRSMT